VITLKEPSPKLDRELFPEKKGPKLGEEGWYFCLKTAKINF
jgi:hypothetical protein